MKIHTIEITNYKAFLGTRKIKVGGKHLFIYGENGSGKSSLYYALKELTYAGKQIDKPHLFLNKARLSAITISIYPCRKLPTYFSEEVKIKAGIGEFDRCKSIFCDHTGMTELYGTGCLVMLTGVMSA